MRIGGRVSSGSACFLISAILLLSAVTIAAGAEPPESKLRLDQDRLTLIPLEVAVNDGRGQPVAVGELLCYGHDLALCHPDPARGTPLQAGRLLVHLPADTYTLIAYGPGFCLTKELNLRRKSSVQLRPEAEIRLRVLDNQRADLTGAQVVAAPSQHKPFLRLSPCGIIERGEFTLGVSRGSKLDIVAMRNPPVGRTDGTGYCLHVPEVAAGARVSMGGDPKRLAQIQWDLVNDKGEHCPRATFNVEIPSLSMAQPLGFWCDQNHRYERLTLWITPAKMRATMVGWPQDQCTVDFYPRLLETKAGQRYQVRAGGRLTPRLLFHPDLNPKQVAVSIADSFGGHVQVFNYPDPNRHATVRLFRPDGSKAHEEMMYGTADKDLSMAATGMDCEVEIDLGFFGLVKVRGRIDDPKCQLQLKERQTPHFRVEWPVELDDLFPEFERTAETCYKTLCETLGVELIRNPLYRQTLFGPGWCGGSTFACHYFFLRDPRAFGYVDDTFKGAFAHELGHVFQGTSRGYSDFGGPSPTHKEAFASMLRNLAKQRLIGARAARYEDVANRQVFLPVMYDLAGLLSELGKERPYDRSEYWRYCFLVSHLMDIYGTRLLSEFARFWGDADYRHPWQDVFDARKLTADEQVCVTYSISAGTNLAKLFTSAGIPVDAKAVEAALRVKAATRPSR